MYYLCFMENNMKTQTKTTNLKAYLLSDAMYGENENSAKESLNELLCVNYTNDNIYEIIKKSIHQNVVNSACDFLLHKTCDENDLKLIIGHTYDKKIKDKAKYALSLIEEEKNKDNILVKEFIELNEIMYNNSIFDETELIDAKDLLTNEELRESKLVDAKIPIVNKPTEQLNIRLNVDEINKRILEENDNKEKPIGAIEIDGEIIYLDSEIKKMGQLLYDCDFGDSIIAKKSFDEFITMKFSRMQILDIIHYSKHRDVVDAACKWLFENNPTEYELEEIIKYAYDISLKVTSHNSLKEIDRITSDYYDDKLIQKSENVLIDAKDLLTNEELREAEIQRKLSDKNDFIADVTVDKNLMEILSTLDKKECVKETERMCLFLVSTVGLGDFYVVSSSMDKAVSKLTILLSKSDYGSYEKNKVTNVKIVANEVYNFADKPFFASKNNLILTTSCDE